jgi:hypothetical protein
MNATLDFVRDFKLADYGISGWDLLIGAAAFIVMSIVAPNLSVWVKIPDAESIKKRVNFVLIALAAAVCVLMMVHAILNENYFKLILPIIWLIMHKNLVDRFYTSYDKFIDKVADKTTSQSETNKS